MKKLYLSIFSAVLISSASGQITTALLPAAGDIEDYLVVDSAGVQPTTYTQTSLNVSSLAGQRTYTLRNATTVPATLAALFPNSTVALNDSSDFSFFTLSGSNFTFDGGEITVSSPLGPITGQMVFTDHALIYNTFPFGTGASVVNDSVKGTVTSSAGNGTLKGITNTSVLSSGNLSLPSSGPYNGTILVKVASNLVLTISTFAGSQVINYDQTSYMYFNSVSKFPLLEIRYQHILAGGQTTNIKQVFVTKSFVGMKENKNAVSFNLFPNPATNEITLDLNSSKNGSFSYEIVNQLGQIVKTEAKNNMNLGATAKKIDLSGLSSGIYFVRLYNSEFSKVQKFIIE